MKRSVQPAMQYPSPQDVFFKLQNSAVALLPYLYKEAAYHADTPDFAAVVLQEDQDNAIKLYRKQYKIEYTNQSDLQDFLYFPNGIYFEELDFAKLVKIFIHFKNLSGIIIRYFDANAEQNGAVEFMYSKAKLLLEYRNRLSGHVNLKNMANRYNYTYNYTNAINDLLAFINFFNTTRDERFKKEIGLINQYAITNLFALPYTKQSNMEAPDRGAGTAQGNSYAAEQKEYQPLRKQSGTVVNKQGEMAAASPKKKKKYFRWLYLVIFLGIAAIAYYGARYGFGNLFTSLQNSRPYRFILSMINSLKIK